MTHPIVAALIEVRNLISNQDSWTPYADDEEGMTLLVAMSKVCPEYDMMMSVWNVLVQDKAVEGHSLFNFNAFSTHAEVLGLIDRTIDWVQHETDLAEVA